MYPHSKLNAPVMDVTKGTNKAKETIPPQVKRSGTTSRLLKSQSYHPKEHMLLTLKPTTSIYITTRTENLSLPPRLARHPGLRRA